MFMSEAATPIRLGKVRLESGVTRSNMLTFYVAAFFSIMLFTFLPQVQTFLLTETLGIPESETGVVSGNLAFWAEVIIIISIGVLGTLSDKIGRKPVFVLGFILIAIGLFLYPSATTVGQMLGFRLVFALGSAAATAMLATVVADYAVDADRGRASGMQGVMNGLGAMVTVLLLVRLPQIFQNSGMSPVAAGRAAYYVAMVLAIIAAAWLWFGLQNRTETQRQQRKSLMQIAREGVEAARDPGIALAYAAAFNSRGDLAVVGTFLLLWIANHGTEELGMTRAAAVAAAGGFVAIAQGFALLGAPIFGIMADRINRVTALMIAASFSAVGYLSTFFITDPFGPAMIVSLVFIGLGEISGVISSGVLIAQQSPRDVRGSVIGVFSFCGAVGILVATKIGGILFDGWREAGPFVLFGGFSVLVIIWGFIVRDKVVPRHESAEPVGH